MLAKVTGGIIKQLISAVLPPLNEGSWSCGNSQLVRRAKPVETSVITTRHKAELAGLEAEMTELTIAKRKRILHLPSMLWALPTILCAQ